MAPSCRGQGTMDEEMVQERDNLRMNSINNKLRETCLGWFGHASRRLDAALVCRVERL